MTVRDLIAELQTHDPDRLVVIARDGEGNRYSPLSDLEDMAYAGGKAGLEKLTEYDKKAGYTNEDVLAGVPAVVLWPAS